MVLIDAPGRGIQGAEPAGRNKRAGMRTLATPRSCLRSRRRNAVDGDRRFPSARSLLRQLDRGVGEHHRPHPRLPLARVLARREAGRPGAQAGAARCDRSRGGSVHRGNAVRGAPDSRRCPPWVRLDLGRRGHRVVRRGAGALRGACHAARRRLAIRDPVGAHRRRALRRHRGQSVCALYGRQHHRNVRLGSRSDPGFRNPTDDDRNRGSPCGLLSVVDWPPRSSRNDCRPWAPDRAPWCGQGKLRTAVRKGVPVSIHLGRAMGRRHPGLAAERRGRLSLDVAPRLRPDRAVLGSLRDVAAATRPLGAQHARDRERRRNDRAYVRFVLPGAWRSTASRSTQR